MAKNSKHKKINYAISEETKHEGMEIILVTKRRGGLLPLKLHIVKFT